MTTDAQVKRLRRLLGGGMPLVRAALKSGMDVKTARRYRMTSELPSEVTPVHNWRTRPDPLADVWPRIEEMLIDAPGLRAKTLFEWLQREYPGKFADGQIRTLQRRMKQWRAIKGAPKEVFFSQKHYPGLLGASDFTRMNDLNVTIQRQPFEHLLYHFVLTYSNWEHVSICFSESFESFSDGLQNALWALGGVPSRHRSDRMSLAVNNASDKKEFTERYEALMTYYGMQGEKIQAGKANENGDVESSHRWLKDVVGQALLLRGSHDFQSREDYAHFLLALTNQRNQGRRPRCEEEARTLRELPKVRRDGSKRFDVKVNGQSEIRIQHNVYSVDSRLIGENISVRVHAEHLAVWYAQRRVDVLPRLRGSQKHAINYRHIIDWLIRKPGAFENYRYRDDLFPTSRFRMAYDLFRGQGPATAAREYLNVLWLAAKENETDVDDVLRVLLNQDEPFDSDVVKTLLQSQDEAPSVTDVNVEAAALDDFDSLLDYTEELIDDCEHGCPHNA